jgi:hypothetical protein
LIDKSHCEAWRLLLPGFMEQVALVVSLYAILCGWGRSIFTLSLAGWCIWREAAPALMIA